MGCTRVMERVEAAFGGLDGAPSEFEASLDVTNAGVLLALPALISNGLVKHGEKYFSLPKGFYGVVQILLLLGMMALARIKNIEKLRYSPPAEWGKILGLDRIPEVRTLREKVKIMAGSGKVEEWAGELSKEWMEANPQAAGILYIDGHVRVYHGEKTKLPKRYVAREKLCLRGMTDYWVNDRIGRPFFVITTPFTTGLLDMMRREIVPRLMEDVPEQPGEEELRTDKLLNRFVLIFDREGYSPGFFHEMWQRRIACQTYNKFPREDWPVTEFTEHTVTMPHGNGAKMLLAERGTYVASKLWMREIRKLTETGHQTAVLSTDYKADAPSIAAHMFSRWSQENFFRYMMREYDIDRLIDYGLDAVDETGKLVNPAYRKLESRIKSIAAKLGRKKIEFAEIILRQSDLSCEEIAEYQRKKADVRELIDFLEIDIEKLKAERKKTLKHIPFSQLPEQEKFARLAPARKQFIDTIKMTSYRAETAMSLMLKDILKRPDDSRSLLKEIFTSEANIIPDREAGILTVELHNLTNPVSNEAARQICCRLNETEILFPGTNMRLNYKLVSN